MSNVRQAKVDDAAAMGRVHVRAWQAAYRGAMPDDFLDSLDADTRRAGWARLLESPRPGVETLVVEDYDGAVVGFAHIGPSRQNAEGEGEGEGELYAINLDPDAWGRGLGQRLLAAATEHLAEHGYREAILWVLDSNARARRLYEAAGWTADGGEQTDDQFGPLVHEVRYRRDLGPARGPWRRATVSRWPRIPPSG